MTRDEIKKILGEGATEEQITNVLNTFHIKDSEIKKAKENLNKFSDYEETKNKLAQLEKEKLSEEERINLEKQEIAKNLKESRVIVNTAKAKEILAGLNVDEELISALVVEDSEKTLSNATKLANSIKLIKDLTAKEVEEKLSSKDVTPGITNKTQDTDIMTFDKFSQLSAEEQSKFARENPEQFSKL